MGWVLNLSLNRYCLIVSTGHLEKTFRKGPFNNYVDKMRGGQVYLVAGLGGPEPGEREA